MVASEFKKLRETHGAAAFAGGSGKEEQAATFAALAAALRDPECGIGWLAAKLTDAMKIKGKKGWSLEEVRALEWQLLY